jgi:hypothetical protein
LCLGCGDDVVVAAEPGEVDRVGLAVLECRGVGLVDLVVIVPDPLRKPLVACAVPDLVAR